MASTRGSGVAGVEAALAAELGGEEGAMALKVREADLLSAVLPNSLQARLGAGCREWGLHG